MARRFRPRTRRLMAAPVIILAGSAAVVAVVNMNDLPSWLAWCPPWLTVMVPAVLGVLGVWWWEPWAGRRRVEADREREVVELLLRHLGRRIAMPWMGDPTVSALALRVRRAIDLPAGPPSADSVSTIGKSRVWPRRRQVDGGGLDPDLPVFVSRCIEPKVVDWMHQARSTGGFLILVGDSAVGKTRLLYQVASRLLPDFAVLAPDREQGTVLNALAEGTIRLPRQLIVWLDELHKFLDGPYLSPGSTAVTTSAIRRLLDAPTPVVILGTLWPQHVTELQATSPASPSEQDVPVFPNAHDLLTDRRVRQITLDTFSTAERATAARLAAADPRLAEALADRDFNVTEVLAGAPELVRRYEHADEEQQAVLRTAIDARRVGIQSPLTKELLRTAARGHLTSVHPDDTWFDPTLAELTSSTPTRNRGMSPLIPETDPERRRIIGYAVADYLTQRLMWQRRSAPLPEITWQALLTHTHDHDDLQRLASGAELRLQYGPAETAYLRLAEHGDRRRYFARQLADLWVRQGRVEDLRVRAEAGDEEAIEHLVDLLLATRPVTDAIEALHACVTAGSARAASRLTDLLTEHGRDNEAIDVLRDLINTDERDHTHWANYRLADLLAAHGRVDEALAILRPRADAGDSAAGERLVHHLATHGREAELRVRADAGDAMSANGLADLLAQQRRVPELRARADTGDRACARRLVNLLVDDHDLEAAIAFQRSHTDDTGHGPGAGVVLLAELLRKAGRPQEAADVLRPGAADNHRLAEPLADLLVELGKPREAIAVLQPHSERNHGLASLKVAGILSKLQDLNGLRTQAEDGNITAVRELCALLIKRDSLPELRLWAARDPYTARHLASLLASRGDIDGAIDVLRVHADTNHKNADRLLTLLAAHNRLADLDRWGATHPYAAGWITDLLGDRQPLEKAIATLRAATRAGSTNAARRLAKLLAEHKLLDELRLEVHAGTPDAADHLIAITTGLNQAEGQRLRRYGLTD